MRTHGFQLFSRSQQRILSVEEAALAGVWLGMGGILEHHPDVVLLHFTGMRDVEANPLFEHDVCTFDQITEFGLVQRIGFMKWVGDRYSLSMDGSPEQFGAQYFTQNVRKVGNLLVEPDLIRKHHEKEKTAGS